MFRTSLECEVVGETPGLTFLSIPLGNGYLELVHKRLFSLIVRRTVKRTRSSHLVTRERSPKSSHGTVNHIDLFGKKKNKIEDMPFAEIALEDLSLPRRVLRGPGCGESVGPPAVSRG